MVISAAAFCPNPPVLVPAVASGAAPELDALRAACVEAITRIARPQRQIVLLGAGERSLSHSPLSRGSFAPYGVALEVHLGSPGCGGAVDLPLSLTVGAWLVGQALGPRSGAVGYSVGPDFASSRAAVELLELAQSRDIGLVVMGDGSARRSTAAPGYFDARAAPFDDQVVAALRAGDPVTLEGLDASLGEQVLAAGTPAWRAAGGLVDGVDYDADLLYADDPYGVGYAVAVWTTRD